MTEESGRTLPDEATPPDNGTRGSPPLREGLRRNAPGLARVRLIGVGILALELLAFATYSTIAWNRYSLTNDFWLLYAPITKISHSGFSASLQTIEQHFDAVILWPLAWLVRLPPHGLLLSYAQDIAVVGASAVAFFWLCDLLTRQYHTDSLKAQWLAGFGLLLLVGDPWVFLTPAFDIHLEAFGTVFIVLAARALERGKLRSATFWVLVTLTCGFVAATYIAGLALGALIAGRRRSQRLLGVGLLLGGALGVLVLTEVGGGAGFLLSTYGYLGGSQKSHQSLMSLAAHILIHPGRALKVLWSERLHILANLAPAGLLGLFWGWGSGIVVVVLLSNMLQSVENLRSPSYQGLPIYIFVAVGTLALVARLEWLSRRRKGSALFLPLLVSLIAADTVGWAASWFPQLGGEWLTVSPRAAHVLGAIDSQIPSSAPVIASQGVVGRFADHPSTTEIASNDSVDVPIGRPIWVVVTPRQGIETTSSGVEQAFVTQLGNSPDAQLVAHGEGVWGFRWEPPPGSTVLGLPPLGSPIGGWVVPGNAATSETTGPPSDWRAVSNGRDGYVVSGDYFRIGLGAHQARITMSSSGTAVVEAWNSTAGLLLGRMTIGSTNGMTVVNLPVSVDRLYPHHEVYRGWGPFSFAPPFIPVRDDIELRVWHPASSRVSVYSLSVSP